MSPFHGKGRQRYNPYQFDLVGVGLTEVACEHSSFAPLPSGMSLNRGFNCCLKQPSYCDCAVLGYIKLNCEKIFCQSLHFDHENNPALVSCKVSQVVDRFHVLFNGISAEVEDYQTILK